jgi:hypothetical protein
MHGSGFERAISTVESALAGAGFETLACPRRRDAPRAAARRFVLICRLDVEPCLRGARPCSTTRFALHRRHKRLLCGLHEARTMRDARGREAATEPSDRNRGGTRRIAQLEDARRPAGSPLSQARSAPDHPARASADETRSQLVCRPRAARTCSRREVLDLSTPRQRGGKSGPRHRERHVARRAPADSCDSAIGLPGTRRQPRRRHHLHRLVLHGVAMYSAQALLGPRSRSVLMNT